MSIGGDDHVLKRRVATTETARLTSVEEGTNTKTCSAAESRSPSGLDVYSKVGSASSHDGGGHKGIDAKTMARGSAKASGLKELATMSGSDLQSETQATESSAGSRCEKNDAGRPKEKENARRGASGAGRSRHKSDESSSMSLGDVRSLPGLIAAAAKDADAQDVSIMRVKYSKEPLKNNGAAHWGYPINGPDSLKKRSWFIQIVGSLLSTKRIARRLRRPLQPPRSRGLAHAS